MKFAPPEPTCAHGGVTFTWIPLAELWMCPLCVATIDTLYATCSLCGRLPRAGTHLIAHRVGRVCSSCAHHERQQRLVD